MYQSQLTRELCSIYDFAKVALKRDDQIKAITPLKYTFFSSGLMYELYTLIKMTRNMFCRFVFNVDNQTPKHKKEKHYTIHV